VTGQEVALKLSIGAKRSGVSGVPKRRRGCPIEPLVSSRKLEELDEQDDREEEKS